MKKWNAPEIAELNITETANGVIDANIEFWWMTNDSKKSDSTVTPDPLPNENPDIVDSLS